MHARIPQQPHPDSYLLIVDDEPCVLEVARIMASSLGWTPLVANCAEHAVSLFRDHAGVVDHVLVDLHLPGDDGLALARRLRAVNADVHIAVMTGDDHAANRPLGEPGLVDAVLVKPFTTREFDHVFDLAPQSRAA